MEKKTRPVYTPAYQSYHSAGDESVSFCEECEMYLSEDYKYCPECGCRIDWNNPL